ncbi:MAG: 4Fe-4S dicluster domain-containing protein, partial [Bryobacterales bacterium]|nr:4Fe-4S dicluster domain-containing protein [Bryobacterales bacterium]
PEAPGNELVRMLADLDAARTRAPDRRRWVMVVDTRKCIGCNACTVACRAENCVGPAGSYRRVLRVESGRGEWMSATFKPANCMQCDNPPCARAVPEGMIRKRPDGIVEFDYARLKGQFARAAAAACPYGAIHIEDGRAFTEGTPALQPYETQEFREYGRSWRRQELVGTARKCHFCLHLIEAGTLPACVSTCIGAAMYFGDASDPKSLVSELLARNRSLRHKADLDTRPRVYYLAEPFANTPQAACTNCHY